MNANTTSGDDESVGASADPIAPDLPFVDGTRVSSAELRAEAKALDVDTDAQVRIEEARRELAATVGELADRLDVPARSRARRDELIETLRRSVRDGIRSPAVLMLAAAGALALVAVVRRSRRW